MTLNSTETIVILDFGSQYTQLIARRVREHRVFSVILPFKTSLETIRSYNPQGVILSGGPSNVYQTRAPLPPEGIFDLGVPVLGICYGIQLIAHLSKGQVKRTELREFGHAKLSIDNFDDLFRDFPPETDCWMSHGDEVTALPSGFEGLAHTTTSAVAALRNRNKQLYGVQFHPEVVHTPLGSRIFKNFLYNICGLQGNWTTQSFIDESVSRIRGEVGKDSVVLGLSGGVDSSVAALLIHKAIGKQLNCIFVDNGLLRKNEREKVEENFKKHLGLKLVTVKAAPLFLKALKGVTDPERKRKIIGRLFVEVFQKEAKKLGKIKFLAQGTLYPDVIESVSAHGGPTSTIKSHHNVGGLPKKMHLKLLEPLRMLFKDEVRAVGRLLGLDSEILDRHPFPGPGLAIRVIGAVNEERLRMVREANWIVLEELKAKNSQNKSYYDLIWQAFAVFLPIRSVGVMGDERTYENVIVVRAVTSTDGMTADWAKERELPDSVLSRISNRIINEVRGVNRVCYDISSKPPSTIEWE